MRNGHRPLLIAQRGESCSNEQLFEYYGVAERFEIRWVPRPAVRGQEQIYGTIAAARALAARTDVLYGRHIRSCWTAAVTGIRPVVFEAHHPIVGGNPINHRLFRHMIGMRSFLGLVVITDALRSHFEDRYPMLQGKVYVAADGADPAPQAVQPLPIGESERLRVGYVGHLYEGRGIELIAALAERCPWAEFHLVGGTDADVAAWRRRTAGSPNLYFHGFHPPGQVDGYRAAMDVLVAPYQRSVAVNQGGLDTSSWMSPLKVFEYMAAGKAIIASDLPVLREVLSKENALLVNPEAIEDWTVALEQLRDPDRRRRLGRRALADFTSHHSWTRRARSVVERVERWMEQRTEE